MRSYFILIIFITQVNNYCKPENHALHSDKIVLSDSLNLVVNQYMEEGKYLSSRYQLADALALFDSVLSIDTTNYLAYFEKGLIHRRLGDYDTSSKNYRNALQHEPEFYDALYNLANNSFWQNQHKDAILLYDSLLKKKIAPAFLHNKGRAHMALGESANARASFNRAIAIDSTYAYGFASLGALAEQEGDYNVMREKYKRAVELAPNSDEYWFKLGIALFRLNELNASLDALDSSLAINPYHYGALFNRARIAAKEGGPFAQQKLDEANSIREQDAEIQRLIRGSTRFPDDAYYHFALGNKYAERKQWDLAKRQYLLVLALEPKSTRSLLNLGNVQALSGDRSGAKATYERALTVDPESVDVLTNLAILSMQDNEVEPARKYWDSVLVIDPKHELAARGLAKLQGLER